MSFSCSRAKEEEKKTKKRRNFLSLILSYLDPARVVEVGRHRDQRLDVRRVRDDAADRDERPDVRGPHGAQRERLAFARDGGAEEDVVAAEEVGREAVLRVGDEAGGSGSPFGLGAGLALCVCWVRGGWKQCEFFLEEEEEVRRERGSQEVESHHRELLAFEKNRVERSRDQSLFPLRHCFAASFLSHFVFGAWPLTICLA